jgi:hypothetical protein
MPAPRLAQDEEIAASIPFNLRRFVLLADQCRDEHGDMVVPGRVDDYVEVLDHLFDREGRAAPCCTDGLGVVGRDPVPSLVPRRAVQSQRRSPSSYFPAEAKGSNWAEYDAALRQRGSLTVWFTAEAIESWKAAPRTTPGGFCQISGQLAESARRG